MTPTPEPTPEQIEARLIRLKLWITGTGEDPSQEMLDIEFLLARDAEKDALVAELRKDAADWVPMRKELVKAREQAEAALAALKKETGR